MHQLTRRNLVLCIGLIAIFAWGAVTARADQVDITIPAAISFNVTDVTASTDASPDPFTISFTDAELAAGKSLRIGVRANTTDFGSLSGESGVIPASLVSWTVGNTSGVTGSSGTLSTSDTQVLISSPNPTSGSGDISFSLAAPGATGLRAGSHTLSVTWTLESL